MTRFLFLVSILFSITTFSQSINRSFETSEGQLKLLGLVSLERLKQDPFLQWFEPNYQEYSVGDEIKNNGIVDLDSITIFMGTWCGDSRREVPRFVKILDAMEFDFSKLKIICVDNNIQSYKQAPDREERGQNIHRVPTFIMHTKDGSEINRIVEEPAQSLEDDIIQILNSKSYEPTYNVVSELNKRFVHEPVHDLNRLKKQLVKDYRDRVKNKYELNTYGYVLMSSFDIARAELVFELYHPLNSEPALLRFD